MDTASATSHRKPAPNRANVGTGFSLSRGPGAAASRCASANPRSAAVPSVFTDDCGTNHILARTSLTQLKLDAQPILTAVARALREKNLEAILIGNAAAALHGAPVTTVDFDFLVRRTRANSRKLRDVAGASARSFSDPSTRLPTSSASSATMTISNSIS